MRVRNVRSGRTRVFLVPSSISEEVSLKQSTNRQRWWARGVLFAVLSLTSGASPAQVRFPQTRPPDAPPPQQNVVETLKEFDCTCSLRPLGWKCRPLSDFGLYSWNHREMDRFAASVLSLSDHLPLGNFVIALQGVADSHAIERFKQWDEVQNRACRRSASGSISNRDLAQLRACMLAETIRAHRRHVQVQYLDPIAYQPHERRYTGSDRATVVYFLGKNGGDCR